MDTALHQLLTALGEPLVDVVLAPAGLEVPVTGLAIVDPDDEPDRHPGQLVLVIGARGRNAARTVRAVGADRGGRGRGQGRRRGDRAARRGRARPGVALLTVRPDVRWERLESLARDVLDAGTGIGEDGPGDLFSLAQTLALLTRGIVVIEDTASRVLAYSRSDSDAAQVDELRRLSILGWQGPADYLRLLREWGVSRPAAHQRGGGGHRRAPGAGHPGPAGRRHPRRAASAGHDLGAGGRRPRSPSGPSDVLLGAARVAAGHLIRRRSQQAPGARWTRELVAGLLDGRTDPDAGGQHVRPGRGGADAGRGVPGADRASGSATSCRWPS